MRLQTTLWCDVTGSFHGLGSEWIVVPSHVSLCRYTNIGAERHYEHAVLQTRSKRELKRTITMTT